jgi:hypothetical protein
MSKRMIHGKGRVPDYWEWTCDLCGKTAHTNSNNTRPAGWVPKGRTVGHVPDFCSPEHMAEFQANAAAAKEGDGTSPEKAEAAAPEQPAAPASSE